MIAQDYVKLPSEDRLYELLLEAKAWAAISLGETPETFYPLRGVAKELLLKLLQEGKDVERK